MSTTSSPAFVRSAATQLPFAPVPRTAIFFSIVFPRQGTIGGHSGAPTQASLPACGEPGIHTHRLWLWIPGPALTRRPGMTAERLTQPSRNVLQERRLSISALLRLQVVLLDEPGHFLDVLAQESGEFLGGVRHRHISELLETLSRLRHADGLHRRRVY